MRIVGAFDNKIPVNKASFVFETKVKTKYLEMGSKTRAISSVYSILCQSVRKTRHIDFHCIRLVRCHGSFAESSGDTWTYHSALLRQNFVEAAHPIKYANKPEERSPDPTDQQLHKLENRLRHIFTDISLLKLGLIHRSAATPNSDTLAWVGDAALHIVITEQLAAVYGCLAPGEMTVLRSSLESREKFRECALEIGLDKLIVIGKSILVSNAKATDSMLAESFEAVLGAVYIDGGIEAVRKAYCSNFPLRDDVYKRKRHLEL